MGSLIPGRKCRLECVQAAHIDPHFGSFRALCWVFLHMGSFDCQVEECLSNLIMTLTLLTEIMTVNGLESDYKR